MAPQTIALTDETPGMLTLGGELTMPSPGTSSVEHLEENVAAAAIELSDEEIAELNEA